MSWLKYGEATILVSCLIDKKMIKWEKNANFTDSSYNFELVVLLIKIDGITIIFIYIYI